MQRKRREWINVWSVTTAIYIIAGIVALSFLLGFTTHAEAKTQHQHRHAYHAHAFNDARPRAWCGYWMRHQVASDPGPAANLARWWAHYGAPAMGPAVGTIVVWARGRIHGHVGMIVGQADHGQWLVRSGNDGHAVRTRARSVHGAIAFRWPPGSWRS